MSGLRFLTAGESHGPALVGILDGLPAGLALLVQAIARDLQRRKLGYGRGGRMAIEPEEPKILSGVRHGKTLGSPLALLIENVDHGRAWSTRMAIAPVEDESARGKEVMLPRPGHADLSGAIKFGHRDLRNSLERASARETAMRVALGAVARRLLDEFDVRIGSHVVSIGAARARDLSLLDAPLAAELALLAREDAQALGERADESEVRCLDPLAQENLAGQIDAARAKRDTIGGHFEVRVTGVPPGLGSYAQSDLRLDGILSRALCSIPAIKAVELGDGWEAGSSFGSQVHDPIGRAGGGFARSSNHAGGLEGGVSNGEPLVLRAAMKPIATVPASLGSIDLRTGESDRAHVERSDTCAVPAAAVVGEAVVALALADAVLGKLGGDSMSELHAALRRAWRRSRLLPGHVFLCGLPGAGKSTLGPRVAAQLDLPFTDVDAEIERTSGATIAEIFSREGESGFRSREAAVVRELAIGSRCVIALGGGALTSRPVRLAVRRSGHLLWLALGADLCAARVASDSATRPLLAGDVAGRLRALAESRDPHYARLADVRLDANAAPDVVAAQACAAVLALEAERVHA